MRDNSDNKISEPIDINAGDSGLTAHRGAPERVGDDSDVRDVLSRALPAPQPPLTITRESALSNGRHARRQRQTWLTAGAAGLTTLLLLTGAAAVNGWVRLGPTSLPDATGGGNGRSPSPEERGVIVISPSQISSSQAGPHTTTGPGPTATGLVDVRPDPATAARLTPALRAAVHQVAPGLTLAKVKGAYGPRELQALEFVPSQAGYKAFAELRDAAGPGTLFIFMMATGAAQAQPSDQSLCVTNAMPHCTARTGPGGELIAVTQSTPASGQVIEYVVDMLKPDGTELHCSLVNYSQNDQPPAKNSTPHPQRPQPPLSVDQLIDVLLSPGLSLAS